MVFKQNIDHKKRIEDYSVYETEIRGYKNKKTVVYVGMLETNRRKRYYVIFERNEAEGRINAYRFDGYYFENGNLVMIAPRKKKLNFLEEEYAHEVLSRRGI